MKKNHIYCLLGIFIVLQVLPFSVMAQIEFDDVTSTAGFTRANETWGASWGDLNGDGRPDLYVSNHRARPSVYQNNGNGTFSDVILQVDETHTWLDNLFADHHGASWADIDNDGDQDLYATTNGCCENQLFINNGGILTNQSQALGLNDHGSGWSSAWFDYNNDRRLDSFLLKFEQGYIERQRSDGAFTTSSTPSLPGCQQDNYAQFLDLDNDGDLELFCASEGVFPQRVFNMGSTSFSDITNTVPVTASVNDSIAADFNGDLKQDIFMTRGRMRPTEALLINSNRVEAWLDSGGNIEKGFTFASDGAITMTVDTRRSDMASHIFIGASGLQPADITFSIDANNSSHQGIKSNRSTWGVYIGYDDNQQQWQVIMNPGYSLRGFISIDTVVPALNVMTTGLQTSELPMTSRLLINGPSGLEPDYSAGFQTPESCVSVGAGDFDNDMDIDLYLVCRGSIQNRANILYENQGNGDFVLVAGAGGAEGAVGIGLESGAGTGENIVVADYDVDGFLDLFVTNGLRMRPSDVGGPHQLFHNKTNANHWIELDLVGTNSNRDGVGAKVYATTNGVTQLREQNGGYHRWAQHHQRIHFGLARNEVVDVHIEWPSGQVDEHFNVNVDNLYRVIENGKIEEVVLGSAEPSPLTPGDECGPPPLYSAGIDRAVFLWKDCNTEEWSMRAAAGGSATSINYQGRMISNQGFHSVDGISLEGSDILDTSNPNQVEFNLSLVGSGEDGFDFTTGSSANVCFYIDAPADVNVLVGSQAKFAKLPLDLDTLASCQNQSLVSINDVAIVESTGMAIFNVTLTESSTQPISVDYATYSGGSATPGVDYTAVNGTLTFQPGETTKTISVPVLTDTLDEGSETFEVDLSNPVNASILDGTGIGIINDDGELSCGAPNYDAGSGQGLYLWQDCGTGEWSMRVVGGGSATMVRYQGNLVSDQGFSNVMPFSLEGNDILDNMSNPNQIVYDLRTIKTGQDGFDFSYPTGAEVCLALNAPPGIELRLGAGMVSMPLPLDLNTLQSCALPTGDECGAPSIDPSVDQALYLWKDCITGGKWHLRSTAGGSSSVVRYDGLLSADQAFTSVDPVSVESSDVFDTTDPTSIDFLFKAIGAGQDGVDFSFPDTANVCLNLTNAPTGSEVLLGKDQLILNTPFDLATQGSCQ